MPDTEARVVERLRRGHVAYFSDSGPDNLSREAADLIERLVAERDAAVKALEPFDLALAAMEKRHSPARLNGNRFIEAGISVNDCRAARATIRARQEPSP